MVYTRLAVGHQSRRIYTYGTRSSLRPLKKRIGTSLILGSTSSLVQYWWQKRARYRAGGNTLAHVSVLPERGPGLHHLRRNQLPDTQECILQDQASDITLFLVGSNKVDSHSATKTLSIYDKLGVTGLRPLSEVVQSSLSINLQACFVGHAGRQSVAAVFQHEHIALQRILNSLGDGDPVSDISSISMEHQDSNIASIRRLGLPQEESM